MIRALRWLTVGPLVVVTLFLYLIATHTEDEHR